MRQHGTGAAGRLPAATRALLIGGVIVLAVVTLTFIGYRDTEAINDRTAAMQSSLTDLALLTEARDAFQLAQARFGEALGAPDARLMASGIAAALDAYNDGQRAWEAYQARVGPEVADPAVVASLDEGLAAIRAAGEEIAVEALGDPSQASQWQRVFESQTTQYNQMRLAFDGLEAQARQRVAEQADDLGARAARDQRLIVLGGAVVVLLLTVVTAALAVGTGRRERAQRRAEAEREQVARRNALDANLQSALEMAGTEDHALSVVGRALDEALPDRAVEVLLANNAGLMSRSVHTGPATSGCTVPSTERCPAARNGQRLVFPTPSSLDACWYLQDRPDGPCSAVCAPLSVAGNAVGVLHVVAADGEPPEVHELATIDLIARKTSESLSSIRAFGRADAEARTDPLTGLLNRRSLQREAEQLDHDGSGYVVAFADLDHFKELNDTHGHAAGDAALRLFARVVRSSIRPDDLTARWGGEEFLVLLPDASLDEAVEVLQRIRANLAVALAGVDVPPFTVSFGAAASQPGAGFLQVVAIADEYLLDAKASGRDLIRAEGE